MIKWLAILLVLAGCASNPTSRDRSLTYEQLSAIKVSSRDCPNIDARINFAEQQLRMRGLLTANPEDLNEDDRKYNATARIIIWSLRIGCSNPDRYKQ